MENDLHVEKEDNNHYHTALVNMQKSLNNIDAEERSKNLVIFGLLEQDITVEQGGTLSLDQEKVYTLLKAMKNTNADICTSFQYKRIGQPKEDNKPRILKVTVPNNLIREDIVKSSPNLKNLPDQAVFKKVFVNRDSHPVYTKENQRLRKRMNEIRKSPLYANAP